MQYLVIGRDGDDAGAPARRAAARAAHLEHASVATQEGKLLFATAMLNDAGTMIGSVMVFDFASREELDAWLAQEPYVLGKVWESIEVRRAAVGRAFLAR